MNIGNNEPQHISTIFESLKVEKKFEQPTRTKSEFADEANINNIVKRAVRAGVLPQGQRKPMFGDFSEVKSYDEAQNAIVQAQENFLKLPSEIREKFGNNVAELLDYLDDPANKAEAIEDGLIEESTPEETQPETNSSDNSEG